MDFSRTEGIVLVFLGMFGVLDFEGLQYFIYYKLAVRLRNPYLKQIAGRMNNDNLRRPNSFEKEDDEWTLKKILVRLIAYPFCIFILVLGIFGILNPVISKTIPACIAGIGIGSTYLYTDIKILILKNRERKRPR